MSQRLVTADVNTNIPGAYPKVNVQSGAVGLAAAAGIVVIIGEADGGASYTTEILKNNFYGPDELAQVKAKYLSGQIVDAFSALSAPSDDPNITGSANSIYIIKTNTSTQASALVDTNYGTFSDQNYGVKGNLYNYQITSTAAEVAPTITGSVIPAFGAPLNGMSFSLRLNGGAASVVTLSATSGNHATIAELVTELNSLLPSGITASAGAVTNSLTLTVNADAAAYRKNFGKSMELIDSTPGDLAALGLAAGLVVSSQEPAIEVQTNRSDIGFSETLNIAAVVGLQVGYAGTSASMTINPATATLTTTVTGGSGANLSINLAQYHTVADLASFINSQTGYSASAAPAAQQLPPSALDKAVTSPINIAANLAGAQPGRVKIASYAFQQVMATSRALSFVPNTTTGLAGLPSPMSAPAFLAGGARGGTAGSDIVNVLSQLGGIAVNIIVPLFSQDASKDILAAQTDSSSTYTIAAINTAVKNHCITYSTTKLKRNRIAIMSQLDTYLNCKAAAQGLANYRCSLTMQQCTQDNSQGVLTVFQPWYAACVAAGMQAGGFYKAIVNKLANVVSYADPIGFSSTEPSNVEDALSAGLLFLTNTSAGNSWVSDQTTYGYDANFVYNSIQAVYTSDILALDMASQFQSAFVGQSLADVDQGTGLAFLAQLMDGYKKLKLIASSSDAPLGYKNPKVTISAPEMDVSVEIKLATAIYFIPITVNISQVQQG